MVAGVLSIAVHHRRRDGHPVHRPRSARRRRLAAPAATASWASCCSRCSAAAGLVITFLGAFFRGPGYNFIVPWTRPFLRAVVKDEITRDMGNWKLARWQEPQTLTRGGAARDAQGPARPACRGAQLIRRSIGAAVGLWLLEVTGGTSASCGRTCPPASAARSRWATSTPCRATRPCRARRCLTARRRTSRQARTYVQLLDSDARLQRRHQPRRRRREHERAHALPALPAPGLQAQLLHHQLLVRVPVPRLALRPAGHQDAELGPAPRSLDRFAHTVAGGVLTVDTSQDHARAAARAAGPAGAHPARVRHRAAYDATSEPGAS